MITLKFKTLEAAWAFYDSQVEDGIDVSQPVRSYDRDFPYQVQTIET